MIPLEATPRREHTFVALCLVQGASEPRMRPITRGLRVLMIAGLMTLMTVVIDAAKAQRRQVSDYEFLLTRPAGTPVMAVVGLVEQRVTIYDPDGKILRASVSTGQTGYETPVGIYSVIQKEAEHYSTSMMTRLCHSCSASHGQASHSMPENCRDTRRRTVASGCRKHSSSSSFTLPRLGCVSSSCAVT